MGSIEETKNEQLGDVEDTICVAVGPSVKENKSTLVWALRSFAGKKICLLHVHQRSPKVSYMDRKPSAHKLKQQGVNAFRNLEMQKVNKILHQYLLILSHEGVRADKVWIEMDNIEKGIIAMIAQHKIRWLVMGAAADKYHSRKMTELKSKKAIFVCQEAPISCHIWFACNGCLIYTRGTRKSETGTGILLDDLDTETEQLKNSRPEYITSVRASLEKLTDPDHAHPERSFDNCTPLESIKTRSTLRSSAGRTMLHSQTNIDEGSGECGGLSRKASSPCSVFSTSSANKLVNSSTLIFQLAEEEGKIRGLTRSEIHDRLEHAIMEAKNSKLVAFEESVKRWRAEEDAMEAICRANTSERLCAEEMSQGKNMEEQLAREKQDVERMKNLCDDFMKKLQVVHDQRSALECQIAESNSTVKELEDKIISAVELLIPMREKRDKLQIEHRNAIREVRRVRKLVGKDAVSLFGPQFLTFTFLEIIEATQNFNPSQKMAEGRYGSVYKGFLRHMQVAIKMLPSSGSLGDVEFQHEAEILSRIRHPHLLSLVGTCPESRSLIYEYLKNGSLEDHLACRGNAPPLSWQTRMQIATDICSALIFLHSNNPHIIHGNLKPSKVILDANFVSKLSDLGIFCMLPKEQTSTLDNKANLNVNSVYIDPEYLKCGELTPESDVYSFGLVLLQILTGRQVVGIVKDVKCALEKENLNAVLDFTAGDWPVEKAKQLANLALRCCKKNRLSRPNLVLEVWSVLEAMITSCNASPWHLGSKEHHRIPSYFLCPIFQEVMKEPCIAADGFTYESEAIQGWFQSGHNTSPMTNLKLQHCNLLPNYALHDSIQGWLQRS